jgi:hypothetical protein
MEGEKWTDLGIKPMIINPPASRNGSIELISLVSILSRSPAPLSLPPPAIPPAGSRGLRTRLDGWGRGTQEGEVMFLIVEFGTDVVDQIFRYALGAQWAAP